MSKHTPGPWKVNSDEQLLKHCGQSVPVAEISAPASACWLAYVQKEVGTFAGSGAANAALIAAAPDLLTALKRARLRMLKYGESRIEIAEMDAVIAKAEEAQP